jgi:hypothetical protein
MSMPLELSEEAQSLTIQIAAMGFNSTETTMEFRHAFRGHIPVTLNKPASLNSSSLTISRKVHHTAFLIIAILYPFIFNLEIL